jgi:hypothetical protein
MMDRPALASQRLIRYRSGVAELSRRCQRGVKIV